MVSVECGGKGEGDLMGEECFEGGEWLALIPLLDEWRGEGRGGT